MKGNFYFAIILLLLFNVSSPAFAQRNIIRVDGSKIGTGTLDHDIPALMQLAKVPGMAIAIFNQNHVVYKRTFG